MIQQNPRASRAPRARRAATTTTTRPATKSTARRAKRATKKASRRALKTTPTGSAEGRPAPASPSNLMSLAPQVQPAAVRERVGVALALLAGVLAVLVARAVAALAALARERAPARDGGVLVQMTAVPADPVVHFPHPRNVFRIFTRKVRRALADCQRISEFRDRFIDSFVH